jgi:hypothetical protein
LAAEALDAVAERLLVDDAVGEPELLLERVLGGRSGRGRRGGHG